VSTVWHRRAGKTYFYCARLLIEASQDETGSGQYYYIAPSYTAAEAIAWKMLIQFCDEWQIAHKPEISKLRITLGNGSIIQLLGVENADRLRGRYASAAVLDEAAQMPVSVWEQVIFPMLQDRRGWAAIVGTPAGWHNLLGAAWADWDCPKQLVTIEQSGVFDEQQQANIRRTVSPEAFEQEFMCSFDAALVGAFYARQMDAALREGRITELAYDATKPVFAAVDLGYSDATAVWYFQRAGNLVDLIDYDEFNFMSLAEIVAAWRAKPYPIERTWLPHDARVSELGTGKTRLEVLQSLGVSSTVVRNIPVHDGIEAVRNLLTRCRFDRRACSQGLEALRSYRSKRDELKQAYSTTPLHDWASHGADAMRYLAVGLTQTQGRRKPLNYTELDRAFQ
jgi:hypothetical protein